MYLRMIGNDVRRSPTTTLITVVFVAAAAALVSLLREHGRLEYLIEFRLTDLATLGAFQAAYAETPAWRSTRRRSPIRCSGGCAISDSLMVAVLLLVSVLVIAIALLCIRFTLLAT